MKKNTKILLFVSVFMAYIAWGSFWIGICVRPVAEECISSSWMLLFTGLPVSFITVSFGSGVGIGSLIFSTLIGGLQWAIVVTLLSNRFIKKRKAVQQSK